MTTSVRNALLPVALIVIAAVAGLYIVKAKFSRTGGPMAAEMREGATLPDFDLARYGGGASRASELTGKVTLINFWATWCDACMAEMPSIVKLYDEFKAKGFDVVAINLDDNPGAVLPSAIHDLHIDFGIFTDPDNKLGDLFDVRAIPLTVIIDKSRKILMIENGEVDWNSKEVRSRLEGWLAG